MTRRIGCLCTAIVLVLGTELPPIGVRAQAEGPPAVLQPETVIERHLTRGEEHRYQIALAAGEFVTAIVEQRGVDVAVQVRGTDDTIIADVQQEITALGREQVDVVADTSGTYTLSIRPAPGIVGAGTYTIRAAARRAATGADRLLQESRTLRSAAARLDEAGRLAEARPLFERALQLGEQVEGPDAAYVIEIVCDLAANALEARDNAAATALYRRAFAVLQETLGDEHPRTAIVQSRLALLYQRAGDHLKAEALIRRAIAIVEKTLGPEHPWLARCLVTLGNLRHDAGDLERAEEIERRAMAVVEKIQETDTLLYANLLNNLADIYRQREDYATAEGLFRRALAIGERLRGSDSYYVSTALQNLGIVARERKDYASAEAYYVRALSIRERIVGPGHADVAQLLNNLAVVYRARGEVKRSLETHLRALSIWETAGGPYLRGTLTSVGNIARLYAASGNISQAIAFQRRADAILEAQLTLYLTAGSEREKLAFVSATSERTDRTISLHLREAPDSPEAGALAALVLLQRKGRVLDALTDTFAAVRQRSAEPGDPDLIDQLNTTTAQLARVALTGSDGRGADRRRQSIKDLEARKEHLESELSAHGAERRAPIPPVSLEAVQAAIPDDGVLLEFAIFRPFDPRAERNAEAYGPPHYAAYVIRKRGAPSGHDLGAVIAIDEMIHALRPALRDPKRTDLGEKARALDERIMRPLRASFGDATRLLISADGELNLVPFEALVNEHGRYLIEAYAMTYLTSGRDLLRMQLPRGSRSGPVILADPLFGEPDSAIGNAAGAQGGSRVSDRSATPPNGDTIYFTPIGGTAEEGGAIKALFPEATLLTGRRATKAMLEGLHAPRMLHLASHGFFLRDAARDPLPPPALPGSGTRAMAASIDAENPLLRSGMALAGANLNRDRRDNGILTALEASGLDLWGTKLVTLSACDTGIGEVRNGEGVYGLRRAFVLAGAETLVMTLWPISDTSEPMVADHAGLRAGLGRGDALRRAKLAMLEQKDRQHPFYWAGFIQSGEWANLNGQR